MRCVERCSSAVRQRVIMFQPEDRRSKLILDIGRQSAPAWTRRQWLQSSLGAGTCALAASPRAWAQGKEAQNPDAKRVLILGDSMIAGAFGLFLQRALHRRMGATVERKGKSSSGLARPDFYDWLQIGPPLAKSFVPDATVVMFGGNDCQSLRTGVDKDAGWIPWGKPKWEQDYRRRIREFCDRVAPVGTRLFWIGMPVMGHERLHGRVKWINTVFLDEMNKRAQSEFVDIWKTMANRKGQYTDKLRVNGKLTKVRAGDGIHLTVKGAHHLVDAVAPRLASALGQSLSAPQPKGRRKTRRG